MTQIGDRTRAKADTDCEDGPISHEETGWVIGWQGHNVIVRFDPSNEREVGERVHTFAPSEIQTVLATSRFNKGGYRRG